MHVSFDPRYGLVGNAIILAIQQLCAFYKLPPPDFDAFARQSSVSLGEFSQQITMFALDIWPEGVSEETEGGEPGSDR